MKRIILLSVIVFIGLLSFSLNPIELVFETENGSVTCVYFEEHLDLFNQLDPDEDIHTARLNKYIDGDTIHITRLDIIGDATRLLGIDTPETVHKRYLVTPLVIVICICFFGSVRSASYPRYQAPKITYFPFFH